MDIKKAKENLAKAKKSLKEKKAAYKAAKGTDNEKELYRILRVAESRFEKADAAYKEMKKKEKEEMKNAVAKAGKKLFGWAGLGVLTVVGGGVLLYIKLKKSDTEDPATDGL